MNKRILSVLLTAVMTASFPALTFAAEDGQITGDPAADSRASGGLSKIDPTKQPVDHESTDVDVANSVREVAAVSEKADNDPHFSIDVRSAADANQLAEEDVASEAEEIIDSGISTEAKKDEVAALLEDSGLYHADPAGGSRVDVTSIYAYQRLRLKAPIQESIDAFGATCAVYYDGYYQLSYDSQEDTRRAYEELAERFGQDCVMVDMPLKLDSYGWGTDYMGMDREKSLAAKGAEVTVAVLDTGIKTSHPAFEGREFLQGYDFVNGDYDPTDDEGHGTSVAFAITESTPSNVKILPIKVMDEKGHGSTLDLLLGLKYADDCGADISNMSLGGNLEDEALEKELNKYFNNFRSLMICSSGNESANMDSPDSVYFPAELSNTICVGAFRSTGTISRFSNYGSSVDFAAPGESVKLASINGSYRTVSGTSFSSPYLAAAAALIKAENTHLDNNGIYEALRSNCTDMGAKGYDKYFGYGCPIFKSNDEAGGYQNAAGPENAGQVSNTTAPAAPKKITPKVILAPASRTYTGKTITPAVTVKDGSKVLRKDVDYTITYPAGRVNAGRYVITVNLKGNYSGKNSAVFTITKAANPMTFKARNVIVSRSALKKRSIVIPGSKLLTTSKARGKVTYTKVSGNKIFTLNKTTGSITVKKGSNKYSYRVRIRATAAGNANYLPVSRDVYLNITIK